MIISYLRIGIRNLLKNKLFTIINILGMAISLASVLIISLYVYDEMRFDKHVPGADLKFRLYGEHFNDDGSKRKGAMVPPMVAPTMAGEFPEVERFVRFLSFNNPQLFEVGDKQITEPRGAVADSTVFEMFGLKLLEGDAATALTEPTSLAINESLRRKYFGDRLALGESMEISNKPYKVSAVFEDFSPYSHVQFNFFFAMGPMYRGGVAPMQSWSWNQFYSYVELKQGSSPAQLEAKLPAFAERFAWPSTKPNGGYYIPHIQNIQDIHLYASDQVWDNAVKGNAQTVFILVGTAIFILVIAVLNFINLSTARAISRVKEVGVRKVMGAFRKQLIQQFLSESILIAAASLLIASVLTQGILPSLNTFAEKQISPTLLLEPAVVLMLLLLMLLVGIAAGAYPALYISAFRPSQVLSNKASGKSGKTVFRQGLVVLQFILSFFLIIASLTVSEQHSFMRSAAMGFDKDNLVVMRLRGEMKNNLDVTKAAFTSNPNVINASLGYGLPGEAFAGDGILDMPSRKEWHINMLTVDHDYVKTLGLELIAGRDFSLDFPNDERDAYILSEKAAKMLGHSSPEEALGHEVAWNRWDRPDSLKIGKVVGVVRDLQLNSMREEIAPVVLHIFPSAYSSITLRISDNDIPATIAHLEKAWKQFNSEWPFEYKFLDENFDRMYKSEEKLATLFSYFTGLTIFVACLGLFGLVVYSTSQRYKEISIRKVLGAGESALVVQLGKTFVLLLAIAFVIAIPISYYAATEWLARFAFRIPVTPWLFLKAGLFIITVALLTVGVQSLKAARANPVDALKEQ